MGSDESHFNVSVGSDWTKSQGSVHKPQPFWRERRAEAVSNRGPSAYQPNALPLGQTGSQKTRAKRQFLYSHNSQKTPYHSPDVKTAVNMHHRILLLLSMIYLLAAPEEASFLSKAFVFHCFLVFRRIVVYIYLDLFAATHNASLMPFLHYQSTMLLLQRKSRANLSKTSKIEAACLHQRLPQCVTRNW